MKLRSLALTGALAIVSAMSVVALASPAAAAPEDDDPIVVLIPGTAINVCNHLEVSTVDALVDKLDLAAALETTVRASLPDNAALVSLKGQCVRVTTSPSATTTPSTSTTTTVTRHPRPSTRTTVTVTSKPHPYGTGCGSQFKECPYGHPETGGTEPMPGDVVIG
jgi:hypothetical protein